MKVKIKEENLNLLKRIEGNSKVVGVIKDCVDVYFKYLDGTYSEVVYNELKEVKEFDENKQIKKVDLNEGTIEIGDKEEKVVKMK